MIAAQTTSRARRPRPCGCPSPSGRHRATCAEHRPSERVATVMAGLAAGERQSDIARRLGVRASVVTGLVWRLRRAGQRLPEEPEWSPDERCPVCGGGQDPCLTCTAWAALDRGELDDLEELAAAYPGPVRSVRKSLIGRGLVATVLAGRTKGRAAVTPLGLAVVRAMRDGR